MISTPPGRGQPVGHSTIMSPAGGWGEGYEKSYKRWQGGGRGIRQRWQVEGDSPTVTVTDEKLEYPILFQTQGKSYYCSMLTGFSQENIIIFTLVDHFCIWRSGFGGGEKKNGDIGGGG